MTILQPDVLLGVQRPRIEHLPPGIQSTAGAEFIDLAKSVGLILDPWQEYHVNVATSENSVGDWAATEYCDVVPRQNGKGGIIECLQLGFLYLLKLPLILHTAHLFPTSEEAFLRMQRIIEGSDDLMRKTLKPRVSNGKEGFQLTPSQGGGRLRYVARSKGSGRGFSVPALFLDEAYALAASQMAAILPTLSAQPNPWVGYFSSAPFAHSTQLQQLRARALSGSGGRLAYLEHSVDPDDYGGRGSDGWKQARRQPRVWAIGNPAFGIRIGESSVQTEVDSLEAPEFDRERLGVPEPPDAPVDPPFPLELWDALVAAADRPSEGLVWAVDVSPDQASAAVAVCWRRADGVPQCQVVDHRPGAGWVAGRVAELRERWGGVWVLDPRGAAGALVDGWQGVHATAKDAHRWCVLLEAAVRAGDLGHYGQGEVRAALVGAVKRPSDDGGWSWARRQTTVDISPLVAVTLAHGALVGGLAPVPAGDPLLAFF